MKHWFALSILAQIIKPNMKRYCLVCKIYMGVRDIDAFGDSLLVVQQINGEFQCFDGLLNSYLDRCLDIIKSLDTFTINHISTEENFRANWLAQQASCYQVSREKFLIIEKPMLPVVECETNLQVASSDWIKLRV